MATDAPTAPPHTPLLYLEMGGSNFFSEQCQALLIQAHLNPDWFGSYSTVGKTCSDAKAKCSRWDGATQAERDRGFTENPGPPATQTPLERPTTGDRYLNQCQSGHLVRDSNFREAGRSTDGLSRSARGDPCRNLVDGYREDHAPSVPMQGAASNPQHEHGLHTRNENADSARQRERNLAEGHPEEQYPQGARQRDEDGRTQSYLDDHQEKWRTAEREARDQPPGAGSSSGAGAGGSATSAAGPGDAEGAGLGKVTAPNCAPGDVVDGSSAAECINSWRRKAEAQMKQDVMASIKKNKLASRPPAQFPGKREPPPPFPLQYQQHLNNEALDARRAHVIARRQLGADHPTTVAALRDRRAKAGEANAFRSAGCLAQQGMRMRLTPPGSTTGRAR
ncbi:hypothetical protein SAMN05443572_101884 [Myxococcus fulvus]|uniref:Uncharacterized protein n=1 Tax=Myxococcus fulvus TaxID=33 RepID=A0A511SUH0_MYXFU|nr:hypothetical protein [Myxococcus fulvus]GEN05571.1 hypothetical protein MFU01_06080 [Myxococcus fulvus]SET02947.1 hypothetical protein SAMN05443572_101884 [Myxococcus fulvus]